MPELLAWAGAIITLGIGIGGIASPRLAGKITQVGPLLPGARAEMRASFGGLYLGLSLAVIAALIAGNGVVGASFAAGLAWIGLALGRIVSFIADRSATAWNWTCVCIELGVGLMLLAPFVAHLDL